MFDPSKKVVEGASEDLAGEQLLAAALVNSIGTFKRGAVAGGVGGVGGGAIGGAIGGLLAGRAAEEKTGTGGDGTLAGDVRLTQTMVFAVTRTRLLVFESSTMGKPKRLIASFPHDRVAEATRTRQSFMNRRIEVVFDDGSGIAAEQRRNWEGEGLIQALRTGSK